MIETREYSDGFERLVQTRSQAGDLVFGDDLFGNLPLEIAILVRKDGAFSPSNEDDLENRKIGVSENTDIHSFCIERFRDNQVELVLFSSESRAVQALKSRVVDAIALEEDEATSAESLNSAIRSAFTLNVDRVEGREIEETEKPRVTVGGWQTYDNKGQVVEKYEPFFDTGWDYLSRAEASTDKELLGGRVRMFYDPRGRVIRTVNPDGSEQRVAQGTINQSNLDAKSRRPDRVSALPVGGIHVRRERQRQTGEDSRRDTPTRESTRRLSTSLEHTIHC